MHLEAALLRALAQAFGELRVQVRQHDALEAVVLVELLPMTEPTPPIPMTIAFAIVPLMVGGGPRAVPFAF